MNLLIKFCLIVCIVMMLLLMVTPVISMHKLINREKMSPFECGFDTISKCRTPFSIQFFSIALMFLIFDIEISILLPIPLSIKTISTKIYIISITFLVVILIAGVIMEWKEGSMNWK
uniref:NADH-ubiquinone oxidoreductase chain 3 n=1 Tax=Colposcenia ignota TaxID=3230277 RepID=A0AAU8G7R3_9HEMI